MTVRQILAAFETGALDRLVVQPMPAAAAWKLTRILRCLRAEYGEAAAARNSLITEDNSVPVTGQPGARAVKPSCLAEFQANPLFGCEVQIEAESISLADIPQISVSDLEVLEPLITDAVK